MGEQVQRRWDVVVFGATGFVGELLCEYLDARLSTSDLSWAIAGRNEAKLEALQARLTSPVGMQTADAHDRGALDDLVNNTSLVISTVGPYAKHGSLLVEAATAAGTDYCDLTGEPQWMQEMIDSHSEAANGSGARILHACGFDSIPSDLGVAFTQRVAMERFGEYCGQISMRVKAIRGGVSGGTVASMLNLIEQAKVDPRARRILANPYALAPIGMREGIRQPNIVAPIADVASGNWIAPFAMATVNTRVVHRTHALLGRPWGDAFLYDEATLAGTGAKGLARATAISGGSGAFLAATSVRPLRRGLEKYVLPKPGEGPGPAKQQSGFFDLRFFATTTSGQTLTTKVTGDRDPGYGSTAKMLGETAMALLTTDPADVPGGFWTPASALGASFTGPLEDHAGLTFNTLD